uniref:Gypsy retrotransposon integrase-like protein 1 n=1 Tax=Gouania willdenowi TaxID=441366 RepID=A0A8C5DBJ5_GOUWI
MLGSILPFSPDSFCGSDALVWGVQMNVLRAPLHTVFLRSPLVSGSVQIGLRAKLPVQGVGMILGNDLAGEKVFSNPEVTEVPVAGSRVFVPAAVKPSLVFPACAVTRAQARKFSDVMDLSDSFLCSDDVLNDVKSTKTSPEKNEKPVYENLLPAEANMCFSVNRAEFIEAQQADPSLVGCFSSVSSATPDSAGKYNINDGVLMRNWCPPSSVSVGWESVRQVVVPLKFRSQILSLGHDNFAGHLGIRKTYNRILPHFFWPGLKGDVTRFCRSCHACQVCGKPNQVIPPAPLHPIPVLGEPFEHIIIDCVGPLQKSKSGYQYLLTLMCAATRYPEAIPLRTLRTKAIIKALIGFFSTFGLPKSIQTDQGSNFLSKLFAQVLKSLSIKHHTSSAYHPQSQGALERFHQTLKSMMRKFCLETGKEWDDGLPFLLLAARESVQESTGFSPAELVFGHTVRGPLRALKEKFLSVGDKSNATRNVLDYVSSFRERLHKACEAARSALSVSQGKMKKRYDKKAVQRKFEVGDKVLSLLPIPGSALQAKFCGPYEVDKKLSDTDYVIRTPDRRRKARVCHINMLKPYLARSSASSVPPNVVSTVTQVPQTQYYPESDGLHLSHMEPCSRLQNSDSLKNIEASLNHLDSSSCRDICELIRKYSPLFSDTPSRTTVVAHDIDVGSHTPIKQHAYRVNPTKRALMEKEVVYLLENKLAVTSSSAWSAPCILVPKGDKTPRFCTDFRKLNNVTKADSYPLPRMEDCVDRVGSAKFVTKLDLLKGYWQVPLTPRASEISAFVTPDRFLQYTVMPFGLRNAPATFQRLMHKVLGGVKNCEVYLDDIVAYSNTWAEHLDILYVIFEKLKQASLTLNLAKCDFGRATVTYLGKQVGQGQVRALADKVQAIFSFPIPQNRRELRRFLGMAGYYRGFCKNFAEVVAPLTSLTSPSKPFVWSPACQAAFESAKALLCSAPVLTAPDFERPFKLEVDASDRGAGAVLLQEDACGIDHPIGYFSKKYNRHQVGYSTIEKEALSLLFALQHFEVYVGSSTLPVVIYTDHNPLVFLNRMRNSNQRLMRWALLIQDFNLNIVHKKGTENVLADALS